MSFNNGPRVSEDGPPVLHLFNLFKKFRLDKNYNGLVEYLITNYPKNVKNRTFNFSNTGHTFHMLYAYVPSPSNKERKQIRLDCIETLLNTTKNDFNLYEDLITLMSTLKNYKCPCELISDRLKDNISYSDNLKNKNFDIKPCKLKKEPIDTILYKYSINWKTTLNKKHTTNVRTAQRKSTKLVINQNEMILVDLKNIIPSSLYDISGFSIKQCKHEYLTEERQLRAGDEAVTFITYCKLCGSIYK